MRYNLISYLIGDGIKNIAKNKKSTFTAIIIMVISMITVGIFIIIGENAKAILKNLETSYPIEVFILNGTTDEQKETLKNEIKNIEYVNPDNIQFINKRDSYYLALEKLGDSALSAEIVGYTEDEHPFPEKYIITLTNLDKLNEVVSKIEKLDYVQGTSERLQNESDNEISNVNKENGVTTDENELGNLSYEEQLQNTMQNSSITSNTKGNEGSAERLTHLNKGINIALIIIGGGLIIFSIIIIGNTIKLTVHARRKEISIMKYVGATNSFIRWPFIVEGMLIGIAAALITILIVGLTYNALIPKFLEYEVIKTLEITFVTFNDMFNLLMFVFLTLGIGIGVVGSMMSMRKYLEV